jgi:hypothetical protein
VSALWGGKGPAILSVVLSALAFNYLFQHHLMIDLAALPRFAAFLAAAILIAGCRPWPPASSTKFNIVSAASMAHTAGFTFSVSFGGIAKAI